MLYIEECGCRQVESRKTGFFERMSKKYFREGVQACGKTKAAPPHGHHSDGVILRKGELYVFNMSGRCTISCSKGTAWVSHPGRFCDYILEQDESLLLRGTGKTIISGGSNGCLVRIAHE